MVPMATPCHLFIEVLFHVADGDGRASFSRESMWPGVPMKGQRFSQEEAPWPIHGPFRISEVDYATDATREILCSVVFDDVDLAQNIAESHGRSHLFKDPSSSGLGLLTRAGFLECVHAMIEEGWHFDFGDWTFSEFYEARDKSLCETFKHEDFVEDNGDECDEVEECDEDDGDDEDDEDDGEEPAADGNGRH